MTPGHVAYNGEMELLNASWSLDAGRTVELRLTGNAYDRNHPFKKFQQKRNGRMGTRFRCAVGNSQTAEIMFNGEVMLAGWKDSSFNGQAITLWLDDEADRHPFAGFNRRKGGAPGDMFAVALVELNDQDEPIDQQQRDRVDDGGGDGGGSSVSPEALRDGGGDVQNGGGKTGSRGRRLAPSRKLSSQAHLMVTSHMFVRWLAETKPIPDGRTWTAELARRWAKRAITVESLSELDQSAAAAKRFEELVRKPYARWNKQEPD